jgi:hypothetical protein
MEDVAIEDGDDLNYTAYGYQDFLWLENASSDSFCSIYVRETGAGAYSRDLLNEGQQVAPGEFMAIKLSQGQWDFRIESCNGGVVEETNVTIQDLTAYTINN